MINSKQINPGMVKALKLPLSDEEEAKLSPRDKGFREFVGKLSTLKIFGWRVGRTFPILDDIEMFGFKEGVDYAWDRFLRAITFRYFRQRLHMGLDHFKKGFYSCDFDSMSALEEFTWKLERLGDHMKGCNMHVGVDQDYKRITDTVGLLKRVIADDYLPEFEKEVADKYGDDIRYEASTKGVFGFCNEGKGPFKNKHVGSICLHRREKWKPENHYEIEKAERRKYVKAHNKRMREWHKALQLIEKHIFEWWD